MKNDAEMTNIQILGIAGGAILLIFVLELVRRKKLLEGYALLWILTCVGLIVFSFWQKLWEEIAQLLGIFYPPAVIFLLTFIFLVLIVLDLTIKISKLTEQNKQLVQRIGIEGIKGKKRDKRNKGIKREGDRW